MIAGPGTGAAQVSGDDGSKLQEPAANGLVGDIQASFGEHLLYIAATERKPEIQPDDMLNDLWRKSIPDIRIFCITQHYRANHTMVTTVM